MKKRCLSLVLAAVMMCGTWLAVGRMAYAAITCVDVDEGISYAAPMFDTPPGNNRRRPPNSR